MVAVEVYGKYRHHCVSILGLSSLQRVTLPTIPSRVVVVVLLVVVVIIVVLVVVGVVVVFVIYKDIIPGVLGPVYQMKHTQCENYVNLFR